MLGRGRWRWRWSWSLNLSLYMLHQPLLVACWGLSLTTLISARMMKVGSRAHVVLSPLLVLSLLDGRRTSLRRLSLGISQTGACMRLRTLIFGLPLLAIAAAACAVTLPGDYGAVDIGTALKKSAADGKLIMLFVSGVG